MKITRFVVPLLVWLFFIVPEICFGVEVYVAPSTGGGDASYPIDLAGGTATTGILPITQGGSGTNTAGGAASAFGVGTEDSPTFTGATLTTPLALTSGGVGTNTAAGARSNLGAAASGANSDITSITGLTTPLPINQGGSGSNTATGALANLGFTASITELNYTDGVTSGIQSQLNGKIAVENGTGTGNIFSNTTLDGVGTASGILALTGTISVSGVNISPLETSYSDGLSGNINTFQTTHQHGGTDSTKISHDNVVGTGTNSHTTIDSHIADTSDPHGASLTQTNINVVTGTTTNAYIGTLTVQGSVIGLEDADIPDNSTLTNITQITIRNYDDVQGTSTIKPTQIAIGTTTPQGALNVVGSATFSGSITANSFIGDGSQLTGVSATSVGANAVDSNQLVNTLNITDTTINVGSLTVSAGNFRVDSAGSITAKTITSTGSITVETISTTGTATIATTSGRVGIGTNTPATALQVIGTVTATGFVGNGSQLTGITSAFTDGGTNVYTTDNVSIGTTTESAALNVVGSITTTQSIIFAADTIGDNVQRYASPVLFATSTTATAVQTINSSTFADITSLTITLTPHSNKSKFLLMVSLSVSSAGNEVTSDFHFKMLRNSTAIGVGDGAGSRTPVTGGGDTHGNSTLSTSAMTFMDNPGTTSATTYKVQGRTASSQTAYINRTAGDTDNAAHPRGISSLTILELSY